MDGDAQAPVGRRTTISFAPKVAAELDWLSEQLQLKQVDVVNRSVSVYNLIERKAVEGRKLCFMDEAGNVERVTII